MNEDDNEAGVELHREPLTACDEASSGEEEPRRRRVKQKPAERKATRKELRAVAPGGLLIEDVLQRIGFDDSLPDASSFDVLVDRASTERIKWCSSFCWTGSCPFGNECKYSHSCCRLKIWRSAAAPAPSRTTGMMPMETESLAAIRQNGSDLRTIVFLRFDGQIVWGRDLSSNAEIWSHFVHGWRVEASEADVQKVMTDSCVDVSSERIAANAGDWMQLPDVVWLRVAQATAVEDIAAVALALPLVSWQDVIDLCWPNHCRSAPALAGRCADARSSSLESVRQVTSLCAASRMVARFLRWPHSSSLFALVSDSAGASGSFGSSPVTHLMHSPGALASYPLADVLQTSGAFGTSPVANLMQSPGGASPFSPPERVNASAPGLCSYMCPAIQDLLLVSGDPVNIPVDTAVLPGGLCMDESLVVVLCRGGFFRAIRRSDLKQVCGLSVREANCFDFRDEFLAVGTSSPARLVAYDLSVPKPSRPSFQLRLDGGASADVACMFFIDASTLVCGLQAEDQKLLDEARIVDCEDAGFVVLHRIRLEQISPLNADFATIVAEGILSVLDLSSQSFDSQFRTDLQFLGGHIGHDSADRPMLATGSSSRFVAVGGSGGSIVVHDLHKPAGEPCPLEICLSSEATGELEAGIRAEPSSVDVHTIQWVVHHVHVDSSVLLVVAEPYGVEFSLENVSSADPISTFDAVCMFAWHLPTGRMLLSSQVLRGHITSFSRSSSIKIDKTLAFGVSQAVSREGRIAHCVVLPDSNATKVLTGRKTGLTGPQRHKVSDSDLRARRSRGMRRR